MTNGGETEGQFQLWLHEPSLLKESKGYFFLVEDRSEMVKPYPVYRLNGNNSFISLPKKQTPAILNSLTSTDKIIEFGFDNVQIQQVNELSFDILVKTNQAGAGLEFGYGDVLAQYSNSVFGLNVYSNDKLNVIKEVVISNPAYSLITEDFTTDIFKTIISGGCDSNSSILSTGIPLTTEFQKLLAVTMEIQDLTALGTISLDEFQMDGNVNYFNPSTGECLPFDDIIYPNPIETGLVCNIMSFSSDFDDTPAVPPFTATAGTDNVLTIIGNNFEDMPGSVEFQNADEIGGALVSTHVVDFGPGDWTAGQIQVKIPSAPLTAGSGIFQVRTFGGMVCPSPAPIEICYAAANFRSTVNNEAKKILFADYPDDDGQFVFRLENDIDDNVMARNATQMAACDWNRATDVNWVLGDEFNNEDAMGNEMSPAIDNVNHIFMAPAVAFDGNPGANMRTIIGGEDRVLFCQIFPPFPPSDHFYTTDIDIAVRENLNEMVPPAPGGWNFDFMNPPGPAQVDFLSSMLHEMGHVHGLFHALGNEKQMYPVSNIGIPMQDIHPKDELGGEYILNLSDVILNDPNTDECPDPVVTNPGLCPPLATNDLDKLIQVTIYPNPFISELTVKSSFDRSHKVKIVVHDIVGNEILKKDYGIVQAGEQVLNMTTSAQIPSGVYFLKVEIDSVSSSTFKIFKI